MTEYFTNIIRIIYWYFFPSDAADAVVAAANKAGAKIATSDLYSYVLSKCGGQGYAHCDGFQLPMNVHYTAAGWTQLAAKMATDLFAL